MRRRGYVKMKRTSKVPRSVVEILGIPIEGRDVIEVPKADVKEFEKWGFKLIEEKKEEKK